MHSPSYLTPLPPFTPSSPQNSSVSSVCDRLESMEMIVGSGGSGLSIAIKEEVSISEAKLRDLMAGMKEEMDHKFSLQVAENKRMQQHLSTVKREVRIG